MRKLRPSMIGHGAPNPPDHGRRNTGMEFREVPKLLLCAHSHVHLNKRALWYIFLIQITQSFGPLKCRIAQNNSERGIGAETETPG
jgi:hypothetical protein